MKKSVCIAVLMFVSMSSFVLADISISEPADIYNLGDRLYINLDGLRGTETGNLNINLVCGNRTTNLIKIRARDFSFDEDQSYSTDIILNSGDLEIANLSEIVGECQVISSLGPSVVSTKTFTISDNIIVSVSLNKTSYNPGEAITANIKAVKTNGDLLDGFIEGSNASNFNKIIENGFSSEIFFMPETIEAGVYFLSVYVYDNEMKNTGLTVTSFNINQIASSIIMSLSNSEVVPGENFTIGIELFDQSGIEMDGAVSVKIISPENKETESVIYAGEFNTFDFDFNSSVGMWRIITSFNDVVEGREFEMLGLQKININIEDSVLSITNIGNILYNKTINVQIGNETLNLELKIDIGETRKFKINANSECEVVIKDGDNLISGRVIGTGNAISISDFKEVGILRGYSIVWIFFIIILGGVGTVFFMKYKKTKTVGDDGVIKKVVGKVKNVTGKFKDKIPLNVKSHMDNSLNFTNKSPKVQGLDAKNYNHIDKSMVDLTTKTPGNAESVLVLKGEKYMSAVVALSIKNHDNLNEIAKKTLHEVVTEGQKNKGVVDWREDYIFVIFSPIVTKTYNNEILATKTGMNILKSLNIHNKKFRDKIEFSIGVHVGELVTTKDKGKLKYTAIGNTISLAKRISNSDSGKLIVSDTIRKKLIRDLKTDKGKDIGGNQVYEILEMKDRSANASKLKDLLKRMN